MEFRDLKKIPIPIGAANNVNGFVAISVVFENVTIWIRFDDLFNTISQPIYIVITNPNIAQGSPELSFSDAHRIRSPPTPPVQSQKIYSQ
jgi:hypothetical protein